MQIIISVFGRWKMSSYDWLLREIFCILFMIFITDNSSSSVLMSSLWSSDLFVLISFLFFKNSFLLWNSAFQTIIRATLVLPFSCPTHPGCSIIPVSSYHLHSHCLNSRGSFLFPIFFLDIAYISSLLCCPVALIWCEFSPLTKQTFFYLFLTGHSLDFLKLFSRVSYATILKFWEIISQELSCIKLIQQAPFYKELVQSAPWEQTKTGFPLIAGCGRQKNLQ